MIGTTLGRYRITAMLGGGGMGMVYAAEHTALGRKVAIKILLPEYSKNGDMVARMFSEARAAASINHPGLVDVHDFGQLADGSAYIIMELLEGETLAGRLKRKRRLRFDEVVNIGRQIAAAVGAVHQKGIIHRDLKPDNVFLCADAEVAGGVRAKVLDFGIAKLSDDKARGPLRTQTGVLMGTPTYMSPEQCRGASAVDLRSDIYSLGCILFEMLTGEPPFTYEGIGEILAAHMFSEPRAPSSLVSGMPPWLNALVLRMMAKRPEDRPQRMEEVATQLGGRHSTPGAVGASPPGAATSPALPSFPMISVSPTPSIIARSPQKKRGLLIGGAVGAAVLTAGVLVALKAGVSDAPTASVTSLAATPGSTSPTPTPPAPRPPVKAETPPPTPTPATQNVQISFGSEPAGAEVTKADGTRLGVTPFVLDVERGAPSFDVTFTIAGRKTETRTVSADDRALSVVFAAPPAEPAEKPPEPQPVADTKPAADVPRPAERPKAKPARPKPRPSDKELIKTTFDN